jgi:hypothetical protein
VLSGKGKVRLLYIVLFQLSTEMLTERTPERSMQNINNTLFGHFGWCNYACFLYFLLLNISLGYKFSIMIQCCYYKKKKYKLKNGWSPGKRRPNMAT